MNPGRNVFEGLVHKIQRRQRKEGAFTVEYYAVTLQTIDGYINFRMEGQHPNIVAQFRPDTVVNVDLLMEPDSKTVLKVRSVAEVQGFKGSDMRNAILDPEGSQQSETPATTATKVHQRIQPLLDQVTDPTARALLTKALDTDAYKTKQAAEYHTHKYEGGLLRHSVGAAEESLKILESVKEADVPIKLTSNEQATFDIKEGLIKRGSEISKSVVIAGALLHDFSRPDLTFNSEDTPSVPVTMTQPNHTDIIDQLASSIRNPDTRVIDTLKNIVNDDIRRTPETFIVSMGSAADREKSITDAYIHQDYLREVGAIADQETSPEIAKTKIERAQKIATVKSGLNSPTGGFTPPPNRRSFKRKKK